MLDGIAPLKFSAVVSSCYVSYTRTKTASHDALVTETQYLWLCGHKDTVAPLVFH